MLPSPLDMLDDIVVNEFTEKSALVFRQQVMKIAKFDPQRPIVVYIDSFGGSVYSLGTMIAIMNEVPNSFITVANGKTMSCGAMLLAAGDMRFAAKDADILIHEISAGAVGDVNDVKNDAEHVVALNEKWMGFLVEKCGKTGGFQYIKDLIKEQDGRNLYFNPAQAKEFGLIDYVGSPHIQPMVLYQIENSNEKDPIKRPEQTPAAGGDKAEMLEQLKKLMGGKEGETPGPSAIEKKTKKKIKKKVTKKKTRKKVVRKIRSAPRRSTTISKSKIKKAMQTVVDNKTGGDNE